MTNDTPTFPSAVKYVTQLIVGHQTNDALMMEQAIRDAEAVGLNTRHLLVVLSGAMAGLLNDQGIDVEDERALLNALAAAEANALDGGL